MNQFVDPNELEPKSKTPENIKPELSREAPVFQDFDGSFKFAWREGHFLNVRGFHQDDLPKIREKIENNNKGTERIEAVKIAADLKVSGDNDQAANHDREESAQAVSSASTRVNGELFLENFFLDMAGGGGILGGMRMPRMWVIEKDALNMLLWQKQAEEKGQARDTVNSPNDPVSARVDYAFVLSPADADRARAEFPSGVIKESSYGKPSFQVEMAGVRFLFLTEEPDKMNALAIMSKESTPANNENEEVVDKDGKEDNGEEGSEPDKSHE